MAKVRALHATSNDLQPGLAQPERKSTGSAEQVHGSDSFLFYS